MAFPSGYEVYGAEQGHGLLSLASSRVARLLELHFQTDRSVGNIVPLLRIARSSALVADKPRLTGTFFVFWW